MASEFLTKPSEVAAEMNPDVAGSNVDIGKRIDVNRPCSEIQKDEVDIGKRIQQDDNQGQQERNLEPRHENVDGRGQYYDDNGQKYREGNELLPDTTFEKNGFIFKTDDNGRVISAEGKLEIPENVEPRNMPSREKVGKGDERPSDERFHLIARMFGAGDGLENLVAGDKELNHGDYLRMETMLKDAVNEGADVKFKVEPVYNGDSNRPSEFRVSYSIDGERDTIVFKNGRGN